MAKQRNPRISSRNPEIVPGVRKFGRAIASQKSARYKFAKKGAAGKQTPKQVPAVNTNEPRFYAADDKKVPLKSRKSHHHATKLRKSITPGTIVIILAGRFRGKRVIVLKQLQSGLLLVTGPYNVNGVPLRRVNQRYVIATSTKVDVSKVDVSKVDDAFFAKSESPKQKSKDGEEFFAKEKSTKTPLSDARKAANKAVNSALAAVLKATPQLAHYLNAKFTLTRGQFPHQLKF